MIVMSKEKTIKMQVIVSEELATKFREKVGQKYGARKGAISDAFSEALQDWVKKTNHK